MDIKQVAITSKRASVTITFDGTAGTGAVGNVPLFTTTGEVLVQYIMAFCTTDLTEAGATATLALGVTGGTSDFVAATTATAIDSGEFWVDTSPDANSVPVPAAMKDILITDNIVGTVGAQAVDGGVLRVDVYYLPLSSDGSVV